MDLPQNLSAPNKTPEGGDLKEAIRRATLAPDALVLTRYLPLVTAEPAPSQLVLTLDDVLPRIPTQCLQPGMHNPDRELHFPLEELSAGIARGRVTVKLSSLSSRYPDVFATPKTVAEDIAVFLPLQKLMLQTGQISAAPVSPPATPAARPPAAVSPTLQPPATQPSAPQPPTPQPPTPQPPTPQPPTPQPPTPQPPAAQPPTPQPPAPQPPTPQPPTPQPPTPLPPAPQPPTPQPPTPQPPAPQPPTPQPPAPQPPAPQPPAPQPPTPQPPAPQPPAPQLSAPQPPIPQPPAHQPPVPLAPDMAVPPLRAKPLAVETAPPVAPSPAAVEPPPSPPIAVPAEPSPSVAVEAKSTEARRPEPPSPTRLGEAAPVPPPKPEQELDAAAGQKAASHSPPPAAPVPAPEPPRPNPPLAPAFKAAATPATNAPPPAAETSVQPVSAPNEPGQPASTSELAPGAAQIPPRPALQPAPIPPLNEPGSGVSLRIAAGLPHVRPPLLARFGPQLSPREPALESAAPVSIPRPVFAASAPEHKPSEPEPLPVPGIQPPPLFAAKPPEASAVTATAHSSSAPSDAPAAIASAPPPALETVVSAPTPVPSSPAPPKVASSFSRSHDASLLKFEQEPLQAIFMTDETLDLAKISNLSAQLPGLSGCMLVVGETVASGGERPDGLDGKTLRELSRQLTTTVSAFSERLPADPTFTLYGGNRALTIFSRDQFCLCVVHQTRGFMPGVRERLTAVADSLARTLPALSA